MTNKQLQNYIAQFPDEMPIKILVKPGSNDPACEFTHDHILPTSETAYINDGAPMNEWDCEDGKIELGSGKQFLLINPIII